MATNLTGTATGLTSGITNALKSATTTVDVSASTAPTIGQVLTATSGTAATWQTPSGGGFTPVYCSVNDGTTGRSITNATRTALAFPAETTDSDNCHDNVTNNTRLTVPTGSGGIYTITGQINASQQSATKQTLYVSIRKNGSTILKEVRQTVY